MDEYNTKLKRVYFIIGFLFLILVMLKIGQWNFSELPLEDFIGIFFRIMLLFIGGLAIELGHISATRKEIGGMVVGYGVGILAISFAVGLI